jgi:hypothetical protein
MMRGIRAMELGGAFFGPAWQVGGPEACKIKCIVRQSVCFKTSGCNGHVAKSAGSAYPYLKRTTSSDVPSGCISSSSIMIRIMILAALSTLGFRNCDSL